MSVYDEFELPTNTGLYFKFEDKVENVIRIASEPITYVNTFKEQESTAYAYLVWNVNEKVAQVMKLSATAMKDIFDLARNPDYGDPTGYNIRITRTGEGYQTKYKIVPTPKKSAIPEKVQMELDKIDPIGVIKKGAGASEVRWLSEAEELRKKEAMAPAKNQPDVPFDESAPTDEPAPAESSDDEEW